MANLEDSDTKMGYVKDEAKAIKMEHNDSSNGDMSDCASAVSVEDEDRLHGSTPSSKRPSKQSQSSSVKSQSIASTPKEKMENDEVEEKVGGSITVKMEPGKPLKLARSSSQKVVPRAAPLFDHLENKTMEATSIFQVMESCTYTNKFMGYTEHAMECDCAEEWDPTTKKNSACGEDSDCINRATKMECVGDCGCGTECENQRFQQRQYANVSVIQTEKKGYGLRTDSDLRPNDFIFEYIGEVINEGHFRRRMLQYDDEGIKHFYFMSLSKGEFVDATKRGNLGRFCNHSCNPNCYVDKWVVGDKLRMGIFAERKIRAGEELVFNYNVDRYGADPQPCYCAEPNCTGFIGGKTQTERATKLSNATIEALGIDDGDGWDTAMPKKPRKKKTGEDDEEYVDSLQPKSLDEDGVTKVMAALMQCKEKWIAVKLLGRIQRCDDERVRNRVVKMHGYQILNSQLSTWKEDDNVVLQILDILDKFPRLTRNKIIDSKIEDTVKTLTDNDDERVKDKAATLVQIWSTLEVGYRIPRKKRDPNAATNTPDKPNRFERRESREERKPRSKSRSRSRSRSVEAPRGPAAPTGPRSNMPQRNNAFFPGPRPPFRRPYNPLPHGWFTAEDQGKTYYYSATGQTTWTRPTIPAVQPPPPPKPSSANRVLQDIIEGIMNEKGKTPQDKTSNPTTPQAAAAKSEKREPKEDKWKSYTEEKQMKVYENTLAPVIQYVMNKFKSKLPRDDLKRFGKECAKKLVASDYKHNRVVNPTKLTPKQEKNVKKYVKEFLDKAVVKRHEHDKKKAEKKAKEGGTPAGSPPAVLFKEEEDDIQLSDVEIEKDDIKESPAATPSEKALNGHKLKRKRDDGDALNDSTSLEESGSPVRRARSDFLPPPPPPPPPPEEDIPPTVTLEEEAINDEGLTWKRDEDNLEESKLWEGPGSPSKRQRSESPSTLEEKVVNGDKLKRKRDDEGYLEESTYLEGSRTPSKRARSDSVPAPPPPPPPPAEEIPDQAVGRLNSHDLVDMQMPSKFHTAKAQNGSQVPSDSNGEVKVNGYQTSKHLHSPETSFDGNVSAMPGKDLDGLTKEYDRRAEVES